MVVVSSSDRFENLCMKKLEGKIDIKKHGNSKRYSRSGSRLMERLMYVSVNARSAIAFAMSCLSQFNKNPKVIHMTG